MVRVATLARMRPPTSHSALSTSPTRSSGSPHATTATRRSERCATQTSCRFFDEWEFEDIPFPKGPGYWAVTRYDDVWPASRNPQLFCSGQGVNIGDMPQEMNEFFGSMINMDDPKHFRLRNIVSKGFTPKQISRVEEYVKMKATAIVDRLLEQFPDGECDFVERGGRSPAAADHLRDDGHPPERRGADLHLDQRRSSASATRSTAASFEQLMTAALQMFTYAQALGEDRRADPGDDIDLGR